MTPCKNYKQKYLTVSKDVWIERKQPNKLWPCVVITILRLFTFTTRQINKSLRCWTSSPVRRRWPPCSWRRSTLQSRCRAAWSGSHCRWSISPWSLAEDLAGRRVKPRRSFLDGWQDSFKKSKTEDEEAREEKRRKKNLTYQICSRCWCRLWWQRSSCCLQCSSVKRKPA